MDTPNGVDRLPDGPVRRMFAAARRHDLDAMVAEFADDYINITPNHPARSFTGSAQVRSNWSALFAGVPDLTLEVRDSVTAPDGEVWVEWASRGTRRDGVTVEQAGVAIFTVREGRLSAVRFYLEPVEHESGDVNTAVGAVAGADWGGART
ncbi:nuclear transport factor 2 family protein [Arthrobacter sp. UYEF3]|uniref:nuclear transport factor 2 family protein n=1 Tax=Arthrobacter sp. UYEF3 TaxID=1756365 RepID=UPI003391CA36